jgi:uncharacterized protein (DUF1015 family)
MMDEDEYDVALFINPNPTQQICKLVKKGQLLPQKATFFYLKLLSGLVIDKFGL